MAVASRAERRDVPKVNRTVSIHRELARALKQAALDGDTTQVAKLHEILCEGLGRPDLRDQVPTSGPDAGR
jgi:hypothetical protein